MSDASENAGGAVAAAATSAPTSAPKKSGSVKLILVVAIGTLVLGGGGAAAYFKVGSKSHTAAAGDVAAAVAAGDVVGGGGEHSAPQGSARATETVTLDPFIVNLLPEIEGDVHYLKATLAIEMRQGDAAEKLDKQSARIRNDVILYLSNMTLEETRTTVHKERIRKGLRDIFNAVLGSGSVRVVYITEFVIQ